MVASFSPHRDAGGTLHFPSPSGLHHSHANSALNQLRRSLSRSPSKGTDFRLLSPSRLHSSPVKHGQFIASLSPSKRGSSHGNLFFVSSTNSPSVAIPFSTSARLHRPGIRRHGSLSSTRLRMIPLSPAKRVLAESRDHGNAGSSQAIVKDDTEIKSGLPAITLEPQTQENSSNRTTPTELLDGTAVPKLAPSRIEKRRSGTFGAVSPLKRGDGFMNIDQPRFGSPVAKRRSVQTTNFGSEFDVFEAETPSNPPTNEMEGQEYQTPLFGQSPSPFSNVPKRSSSLRKSTLQQRQNDRLLFSRNYQTPSDESPENQPTTPTVFRSRPRGSLENNSIFSPAKHESFTPVNGIFASTSNPAPSQFTGFGQPAANAHPLSRTITQSSSGSSFTDDSPTHAPAPQRPGSPRPIFNFSKSLPAGASRPLVSSRLQHEESNGSDSSFATPENYRLVKPLPAAFMSTGLISKKNRNVADVHNASTTSKNMPDTPCKRASNMLPGRKPFSHSIDSEAPNFRTSGSPWTPTNTSAVPGKTPAPKGMGIFGRSFIKPALSRRGSFVSIDGDDGLQFQSPSGTQEGQLAMDSDLPPTPTKRTFRSSLSQYTGSQFQYSDHTPASTFEFGGAPGQCSSPSNRKTIDHMSPHTPQDHMLPPDPSGLSISAQSDQSSSLGPFSFNLPATPTGPREYFSQIGKRSIISLGGYSAPDVDPCLTSRFDKVELIGTGEFSQVYCVTERPSTTPFQGNILGSSKRPTTPQRLWAVKKSKHPFSGVKDRERRNTEVAILRALKNSDHIISFTDSWEENNYLYIQTEFCEEGSLDVFLSQVGLKARLDDFRIWKILLELSHGLKCIHDSGFIHLDLKPANILITFEGVLKIADFGMATCWPAAEGIEGEGDREYIGPEVLMGRYDKPADIFALGLIMFEIAGNVELPDNGVSWQKLRNGDMSDVPSLTWSSETSIMRDASGNPMSGSCSFDDFCASEEPLTLDMLSGELGMEQRPHHMSARSGELSDPPDFMINPNNDEALDRLVRWMISPDPSDRPVADQVIQSFGVQWTERRRRAGATIYEGSWGPADEVLVEDAEMIDV